MGDYEEYWSDREKVDADGELPADKDSPISITESFLDNGESVAVEIVGGMATFNYANGTSETVPMNQLWFCTTCMKKGTMPFYTDTEVCPTHDTALLKFTIKDYENFKLLSKMEGGILQPQ